MLRWPGKGRSGKTNGPICEIPLDLTFLPQPDWLEHPKTMVVSRDCEL